MNTLFPGGNLDVLREYIGDNNVDNSVDLVYLDPPYRGTDAAGAWHVQAGAARPAAGR